MASFNKFNALAQTFANGGMSLSTDTLKLMLTNTLPVVTNSTYADVSSTELANGNGYITGGASATVVSSTQAAGIEKLIISFAVPTWVAAGPMGPFQYAILYNATATSPLKPLIGWFDYGSAVTLTITQPFTATPDVVNGILQIQ